MNKTQPSELAVRSAKSAVRDPIFNEADDNIGRAVESAIYRMPNSEVARCFLRLVANASPTPEPCRVREALIELREAQDDLISSTIEARSNWRADERVESADDRLEKAWATIDAALSASPAEPEATEAMFRMQRGPPIPWRTAEVVYTAYKRLYGDRQSLQRLHERGGFGWKEVEAIFDELQKRDRDKYRELTAMRSAVPIGGK